MNKIFRVVWSQATQSWAAVSELTKAHKKQSSSSAKKSAVKFSGNFIKSSAIALSLLSGSAAYAVETAANGLIQINSKGMATATSSDSIAIGKDSKATGNDGIALGYQATADKQFTVAIGAGASSKHNNAVAIGKGSQALGATSLALVMGSKATGNDSYAIGWSSDSIGEMSMAFGRESKARKKYDIVFGAEANTRDEGQGHSIAIGLGAMSGTHSAGKNLNGGDAGGVAIGTGAYTGVNKNNISLNSAVAVGAGAGAGYREVDADGLPTKNTTDQDTNDKVLVKAFGGTIGTLNYFKNTGNAKADGFFSFQNVNINEAIALGRNTRAIGDQSVAIGAQSIAGQGSIVIGGNDIQAYDGKKYFKAKNPDSEDAKGVNDFNAETTPGTGKNGQPIRIKDKYKELVGSTLDNTYRSSYGQDGSTVIGMQAHSTTPLGVAIGTNSIVRKGAFGATAIGSGASVVANAEAAVAIGMGSEAQGNYAVAAGTGANAKESAVAAGYQAKADKSAVAVGDSSNATTSSVAVGQLAKAEKVADIAVGQGAVASGEQGAIAMGLGTRAQGDSSIMIGGSEITKVAAQTVKYQKEKKDAKGHAVIKTTKKKEQINGEEVERTIRSVEMEAATGTIQDAYGELTNGATLNTATLDYSSAANKNGHGSISMGIHSLSTGDLGTAIGTGARVTKLGGVALGTGAISELQNGVAIGTGSRADANSIGTRQTDISYDKEGHIVPFDSKKVAYTFYWAGGTNTSEGDVVSFGTPGAERQLKNVAAGRIADDSTDAINGSQLNSVTKRMSSGWSVEGEKDHGSSGVLKLKGTEATGKSVNYADDGKSFTNGEAGTATGQVDKVRLNDEVKIRVGDNLVLNQEDASRPVYEDPDNKNRQTGTRITSKFTYSLNPVLKNLTSATFKNDAGDTTVINGAGMTVTPVTMGKQAVSLTTDGLNNGGNAISNVAGNLPDTKNNDAATGPSNATKSQDAPTLGNTANQVNPTNAATVGDVLNAGWNIQGDGTAVDFVKPYDTVNFVKGDGTSVTVESADGKTSTVKYSVNLGNGLEKDANNNITVKAADKSLAVDTNGVKVNPGDKSLKTTDAGLTVNTADKSLEVTNDGLKAKTDGTTITTGDNGLKVVTGGIESVTTGADSGTVKVKDNDAGKIATVDSVVNAVNNAAWTATSGNAGTGTVTGTTAELIKAGNTVTFKAGDNLAIKQDGKNFIYSLKPALSGLTSAEFKDDNNNTVNITPTGITITKPADTTTNTPVKTVKLSQDGLDNGGNGISNVKSGLDTYGGNVPGTTAKNTGLVDLSKPTTGEPKVSDNTAATVGDLRNMGWIVSSDKTTGADGAVTAAEYSDKVKNANEVKFVGKNAAKVSGKTDPATGIRTITVDVEVPDVKTAELVSSKDGSVIAPSTNPELQKALKDAKDELAAAATPEQKEAAENKVKAAETELNKALDNKGVATAKNVADAINNAGFNLKTSADGGEKLTTGTKNDGELIKPGNTVEMIAGKNLTVKQDESGKITYATKDDVEFNTVKVGTSDKATNGKKPVNLTTEAAKDASNNDDANKPTTALNISSGTGTDVKPTQLVGVGSVLNKTTINTTPTGTVPAGSTPTTADLVDLKGTDAAPVNKNAAATVGDLQNMGWVVSSDKATSTTGEYKDVVKNANEVRFVGEGTAVVSGKTDGNVRTITVKVDDQVSTNNAVTPVNYTKKDGTKVYPKEITNADGTKTVKFFENPNGTGTEVPDSEVITSVNGPKGTKAPTTLSNVEGNLDGAKTGTTAPTDSHAAPNTTDAAQPNYVNTHNAATVGDVLNAGWNLQNNGAARDFVKPYDTVNFINGLGTTAVVTTRDGSTVSDVTFNVKPANGSVTVGEDGVKVTTGEITSNTNGSVAGPTTPANAKTLKDALDAAVKKLTTAKEALKAAETALAADPNNATLKQAVEDKKADVAAKQAPVDAAQKAHDDAGLNKVATVQNVADAINNAGFNLKTSADGGEKLTTGTKNDGELIKPGNTVEMIAGKNLTVKQDESGKITYATKDDVEFNTVKVGTSDKATNGKKPVNLTTEAAKDASNNDDANKPTTALNISSGTGTDVKPTQLVGVGSVLNKTTINTTPTGTVPAGSTPTTADLVDLKGTDAAPVNKNAAATVGDLQNMGWVVSAKDGNGYKDVVKNANEVDFKGGTGIEITGKTLTDGTREITVGIKEGTVTNNVKVTKEDGTVIDAIRDKDGKLYEKDVNGKVDKTKPVKTTNKDKVENNGSGFVTGNTVATAIQESGWNVGLADSSKANEAFNDNSKALSADTLEKVNPDDNVRFADGKNTKVQAATMDEVNKDGKTITNTYVRFNVDLPISQIISEDKDGNKVAKAADGKWYPVKEGKPDTTKEALEPSNVRTSASMDPDGLGDKYNSTTSRKDGLTPIQLAELTGKQEAAATAAKEKIKDLLKGQSEDVIEAASKAAVNAAKEEAKVQYLKDKGLDKGTGGTVISNVAWGTKPSDAVNVDQLQNSGINIHSSKVEGSTGKVISAHTSPTKVKMDETVNIDAGNNIEITRNGRDIAIATSMNPQFDSVQFGEGPKITGKAAQPAKPATATSPATPAQPAELSVNGAKITNVAPGRISATSTDAINGSQLYGVAKGLDNRINNLQGQVNKLGNRMNAGMATSAAMANLLQPHKPGQSVATAGIGQHKDQAAVAVGYSRVSDNGKYGVRFSMGANTQGEVTSGAAVGYFW